MTRLISLNVERSKHLERFVLFLRAHAPDVVCLQELTAPDIPRIQHETGLAHSFYVPMAVHPLDGKTFGVGILARTAFRVTESLMYAGTGEGTLLFDRRSPESRLDSCRYVVARVALDVAGEQVTVGTTHFPWTPDGLPRPFQTTAVHRMIALLGHEPIVLTGDFNAPRGTHVFGEMARVWRDCVPPEATTSLDPDLHRAGPLDLMVDGIFTSPHFTVDEVRLHTGVSDHQAISARVNRVARNRQSSTGSNPA